MNLEVLRLRGYVAGQQQDLLQYLRSTQVEIFPNPVRESYTALKLKRVIQTSYTDGEFVRLRAN